MAECYIHVQGSSPLPSSTLPDCGLPFILKPHCWSNTFLSKWRQPCCNSGCKIVYGILQGIWWGRREGGRERGNTHWQKRAMSSSIVWTHSASYVIRYLIRYDYVSEQWYPLNFAVSSDIRTLAFSLWWQHCCFGSTTIFGILSPLPPFPFQSTCFKWWLCPLLLCGCTTLSLPLCASQTPRSHHHLLGCVPP